MSERNGVVERKVRDGDDGRANARADVANERDTHPRSRACLSRLGSRCWRTRIGTPRGRARDTTRSRRDRRRFRRRGTSRSHLRRDGRGATRASRPRPPRRAGGGSRRPTMFSPSSRASRASSRVEWCASPPRRRHPRGVEKVSVGGSRVGTRRSVEKKRLRSRSRLDPRDVLTMTRVPATRVVTRPSTVIVLCSAPLDPRVDAVHSSEDVRVLIP
jgi:hypothetical protein